MNKNEVTSDIQIENGEYCRIHNQILEKLASSSMNGSEFRCLLFLLRKTYGWNKKEESISYAVWSDGTGINRKNIIMTINKLVSKKIIYCIECENNHAKTYGFNKYFNQWTIEDQFENRSDNFVKNSSSSGDLATSGSGDLATSGSGDLATSIKYSIKDKIKDTVKNNIFVPENSEIPAPKEKHKYGEFKNVLLTDDQIQKLKDRFPDLWEERIQMFSEGKKMHGYKYQDDYLAILNWARREGIQSAHEEKFHPTNPIFWNFLNGMHEYGIVFYQATNIFPLSGEKKKWIDSIHNLSEAGITPEVIPRAVKKMRDEGLTIKSPESILAIAREIMINAGKAKDGTQWTRA